MVQKVLPHEGVDWMSNVLYGCTKIICIFRFISAQSCCNVDLLLLIQLLHEFPMHAFHERHTHAANDPFKQAVVVLLEQHLLSRVAEVVDFDASIPKHEREFTPIVESKLDNLARPLIRHVCVHASMTSSS